MYEDVRDRLTRHASPFYGPSCASPASSPVGTPRSKANQGYTIPNKPFILDPLL